MDCIYGGLLKWTQRCCQIAPDHPERIELNARGRSGFMWACRNGHKDVVQLLLDHSERIELNARDDLGFTAFMRACNYGNKDVVKLLLEYSEVIDTNIPDNLPISKDMKNLLELH